MDKYIQRDETLLLWEKGFDTDVSVKSKVLKVTGNLSHLLSNWKHFFPLLKIVGQFDDQREVEQHQEKHAFNGTHNFITSRVGKFFNSHFLIIYC